MSTRQHGTLVLSIISRLGLLLALMLPSIALAETAALNVPILLRGSIDDDACPEKGRVFEVRSEPEGFLPVQSGRGEAPFREIGRLHDGDMVVVCEKLGPWLGVVCGAALLGCRTTILVPVEQTYTGPCDHGWVMARNVNIEARCAQLFPEAVRKGSLMLRHHAGGCVEAYRPHSQSLPMDCRPGALLLLCGHAGRGG